MVGHETVNQVPLTDAKVILHLTALAPDVTCGGHRDLLNVSTRCERISPVLGTVVLQVSAINIK